MSLLPTSVMTLAVPVSVLSTTVAQALGLSLSVGAIMFPDDALTIICGRPISVIHEDMHDRTQLTSLTSHCNASTWQVTIQ